MTNRDLSSRPLRPRRGVAALAAGALALTGFATGLGGTAAAAPREPADRFIVVLHDGTDARSVAADHARRHGVSAPDVYEHALDGYAGRMTTAQHGAVARDARVKYIERDAVVRTQATQANAPWGLDRIDQRSGLSTTFTASNTGAGVTAYIIDSGIRTTHADFGGRAVSGFDAIDGGTADDCNGHGTHVAGTVGGATHGVAKGVDLVAVRVLGCDGSGWWSGIIAGMDWVTANRTLPAVANLSLGGGASRAADDAAKRLLAAGVTTVVAAGNGDSLGREQDACRTSPARVPGVLTIGATDVTDAKTSWSNYGKCVDFFAPGAGIVSTWSTGDAAIARLSGTSMATPHVAGAAALHLQSAPLASPAAVRTALFDDTTKGVVKRSRTLNNHLLFTDD